MNLIIDKCYELFNTNQQLYIYFTFHAGALKFELNPSVYDGGTHTLTIIAVNIMGETSTTHISFGKYFIL